MNTRARSSRDITLPIHLLTTDSLQEAADSLLNLLARIAPDCLGGWLALGSQGGTGLTALASIRRRRRGASATFHRADCALLTAKESALLQRAYVQGRSFTQVSDSPSSPI